MIADVAQTALGLVEAGIDSISLNPDSVAEVRRRVAAVEAARAGTDKEARIPGAVLRDDGLKRTGDNRHGALWL